MLSKSEIKLISSLSVKKNRTAKKLFVVEGEKSIAEGLNSQFKCELVVATDSFSETNNDIINLAVKKHIRTEVVRHVEFKKITNTVSPQGILALFKIPNEKRIDFSKEQIIVALENISDPGNLGTIIRTCDWFGVKNILLSENCSDLYNPKTIRSTMGSVFHVTVEECKNFFSSLTEIKNSGYTILTADMEGKNVFNYKLTQKNVLCFCNEANGPSNELRLISSDFIHIPSKGKAESLNVSSAAAVIISHITNIMQV